MSHLKVFPSCKDAMCLFRLDFPVKLAMQMSHLNLWLLHLTPFSSMQQLPLLLRMLVQMQKSQLNLQLLQLTPFSSMQYLPFLLMMLMQMQMSRLNLQLLQLTPFSLMPSLVTSMSIDQLLPTDPGCSSANQTLNVPLIFSQSHCCLLERYKTNMNASSTFY